MRHRSATAAIVTITALCVAVGLLLSVPGTAAAAECSSKVSAAAGVLSVQPDSSINPVLPVGSSAGIVVTVISSKASSGQHVRFTVCGTNASEVTSNTPKSITAKYPDGKGSLSATLPLTDKHGAGEDKIIVSYTSDGRTSVAMTSVHWENPVRTCPIGLPTLFAALGCSAAGKFVATAWNTGGCLIALLPAAKLLKAVAVATKLSDAEKAANKLGAADTSVGKLFNDLKALKKEGVSLGALDKAVDDATSVRGLLENLSHLVHQVVDSAGLSDTALALTEVLGLTPCVNLIAGSVAAATPTPSVTVTNPV